MNTITKRTNRPITLPRTGTAAYDTALTDYERKHGAFTLEGVREYATLCKETLAPSTVNVRKAALKKAVQLVCLDEAHEARILRSIDTAFGKTGKRDVAVHAEDVLSRDEIQRIASAATRKQRLIVQTLATTGVRVSELLGMKHDRVTVRDGAAYIRIIGKGRKERRVIIAATLYDDICRAFGSTGHLFTNERGNPFSRVYVHRIIRTLGVHALGRVDVHPHTLRHSFATNTLAAGKSLKAVSRYLGHSTTAITADVYVHDELTADDVLYGPGGVWRDTRST